MRRPSRKNIFKTIILLFFIMVGSVLIWRSVWEMSEEYLSPGVSFVLGILILFSVGIYSRRLLIERL